MRNAVLVSLVVLLRALPAAAQAPNLPANSVVNAASFAPGVAPAPGSIISIFGTSFASQLQVASSIPLSTSMGGVSVMFNGSIPAPLYFVSQGQINAELPAGLTGSSATIQVRNGSGSSATQTVTIAPFSPSIFTITQQGNGQAIVVFSLEPTVFAGTVPGAPGRPAKAGDFLTIYANGLGAVSPAVPDGNAAPGTPPLATTTTTPTVTLGGKTCTVLFSGLVPGLVSLYQINIQVPTGVTAGNAELLITMGGVTSLSGVTIAVQ